MDTFLIIFFLGLVVGTVIRSVYTRFYRSLRMEWVRKTKTDQVLTALPGFGMLVFPLMFVLTDWLAFADYSIPDWMSWVGVLLYAISFWVLWRSHFDLGKNWSPSMEIREQHELVTEGVYRYIRHPMYAGHLLWGLAQPLLLHNWVAGGSMLVLTLPLLFYRVPREESMLQDYFGEGYRQYQQHTGRFVPKIYKKKEGNV